MTGQAHDRTVWIDATSGVAGDMLLAALLDAGARLDVVRAAVEAVVPGEVSIEARTVRRAGLRAIRVEVAASAQTHPHRSWRTIRRLLTDAALPAPVGVAAREVFARLADAEGRVHGIDPDEVAFHEVGAWDSIADVVGVCAALADLHGTQVTASPVALGAGRVTAAHGDLPVPAPAVLELARGWQVLAGGTGELATPTGMALVRTCADACGPLPPMTVTAVGVGAGSRDVPGRANVTRVVVGEPIGGAATPSGPTQAGMVVLATNVDDLDPRVWPTVLAALLAAGAADAWLTPIVMKKGRPAHTLSVLAAPDTHAALQHAIFALTGTLGVRTTTVTRTALDRAWVAVDLPGGEVRIKLGLCDGRITAATPEFDDVAALAAHRGQPVRQVLAEAVAEAGAQDLRAGAPWPASGAV